MPKRDMSASAVVACSVAAAPAVVACLVAAVVFGFLHYATNRWLLDTADGSVRSSLWAAALWAVFLGVLLWWSQRRASRREKQVLRASPRHRQ